MARKTNPPSLAQELADFLVTFPTRQQLLSYRPSARVQRRASELMRKLDEEQLTVQEEQELDGLMFAETLLRLVKAKLRAGKGPQS